MCPPISVLVFSAAGASLEANPFTHCELSREVFYGCWYIYLHLKMDFPLFMLSAKDQTQFHQQLLKAVANISARFVDISTLHFEQLIQQSLEELGRALQVDRMYLTLWDYDEEEMGHVYEWQADGVRPIGALWWRWSVNTVPWLRDELKANRSKLIFDRSDLPEVAVRERSWYKKLGASALLMQPVFFDGCYSGILGATSYKENLLLKEDLTLITIVADILSNAMEHQRQRGTLIHANTQLRQLSEIDALTGIANRRVFDNKLMWECRRSARIHGNVTVLLADIDYFKKFNDYYGHPEGDACLKLVANLLKNAFMREGESPARYGGEEFAVVCGHNIDPLNLFAQAQRWRKAVQGLGVKHEGSPIADTVTISIGIASMAVNSVTDSNALLKKADEMLYIAKSEGRNRVVIGDSLSWRTDDERSAEPVTELLTKDARN